MLARLVEVEWVDGGPIIRVNPPTYIRKNTIIRNAKLTRFPTLKINGDEVQYEWAHYRFLRGHLVPALKKEFEEFKKRIVESDLEKKNFGIFRKHEVEVVKHTLCELKERISVSLSFHGTYTLIFFDEKDEREY